MRNTRSAFTLVELIVVITILAILGTIAFISLQGYSADARNSKRTEDLNSIVKSIEIKVSNGSNLLSFVTAGDEVGAFSVAGADVVPTGTTQDYTAGIPNYSAVGIKSTDFTDPSDASDYRIGLTTKKDGEYEIAATMENGSGDKSALIVGTYNPRTQDVLTAATIPFAGTKIVLQDADINKIKR
jgi:prepilin-type N-terminal cleavage/methylation domain-containing protein